MLAADLIAAAHHSTAQPLGSLTAQQLLALQSRVPARYPVLLESAAASLHGRNHDILMAFPGDALSWHAQQGASLPAALQGASSDTFLAALDRWWQQLPEVTVTHDLPFHGGWFIYLSYELAAQIEPSLRGVRAHGLIARAIRMPAAIVRNSETGEAWYVAETEAQHHCAEVRADLASAQSRSASLVPLSIEQLTEDDPQLYVQAVQRTLAHIAAGDVYQANLSRGWRAQLPRGSAPALYRALRAANPGPFAGLAMLDAEHVVISSSPERLLEVRDGWISTRPIAGTRPRGHLPLTDQVLLQELQTSPKERAEHIMLLDLERNDLGRICIGGTVAVNEFMSIESYAHVHHIVSNVRGRLREHITPGAAIAAVFPGGTITGCPKVRCMEIIADLEHTARGAYTGSMGYLNRNGSMDLNILIRTLELHGDALQFRAGAGIVADSLPLQELDETRAKARGMLRALQRNPQ